MADEFQIPLGMQMAIKAFARLFGFNPKTMIDNLEIMTKSIHNGARDMAEIKRQNSAIMSHLGIAETLTPEQNHERPLDESPHAESGYLPNGSGKAQTDAGSGN